MHFVGLLAGLVIGLWLGWALAEVCVSRRYGRRYPWEIDRPNLMGDDHDGAMG